MRVLENGVPGEIYCLKREEVTGELKEVPNAERQNLNSSPYIFSGD
jgi:hypothetical protein